MDIAAERNFGLDRGAMSAHIRSDLQARSDNEAGQKSLSPGGFAEKGPATSLFLSRRSVKDILLRHASSAGRFGQNSNIQSFLTGCLPSSMREKAEQPVRKGVKRRNRISFVPPFYGFLRLFTPSGFKNLICRFNRPQTAADGRS
jgi:hypothetical protein